MLSIQDISQRKFFDKSINQFPLQRVIKPSLAHQLEVLHIIKLLNLTPPKNIMDFGSGNGRIAIPLLRMGFNLWAVDISYESLKQLTITYNRLKTNSWGKLYTSTTIPKKTEFDAVVGSDILHHVPIKDKLHDILRTLKPNGIIVFSEPNAWHFPWYIYIFFLLSWNIEKGILHCSIPELNQKLASTGFDNIKIEGHGLLPTSIFNFFPFSARLNALSLGNLPLVKFFSFRLIVSAKNHNKLWK